MRFRATIEASGKTATGIRVPEEVVTALCCGKRRPVSVAINGYRYRSTVAPRGGDLLPVERGKKPETPQRNIDKALAALRGARS